MPEKPKNAVKDESPFPERTFPEEIFPRDVFPWMGDDIEDDNETKEDD